MRKFLATLLIIMCVCTCIVFYPIVAPWSNGGYSTDPNNPVYGTHDWIAQHALDFLPPAEKQYITNNLNAYLFGTELPDNSGAPGGGFGDTTKHHVYYHSTGALQDDASAVRARTIYTWVLHNLSTADYVSAAKWAGTMSHYIVDPGVFGHVMAASTDWGAEVHHSDYEDYVTARMTNYTSTVFDPYIVFDGKLDLIDAYNGTLDIARNTTFGDGGNEKMCTWMDANYDWSSTTFKDSCGASLNHCVNILADVLHTIAVKGGVVSEKGGYVIVASFGIMVALIVWKKKKLCS